MLGNLRPLSLYRNPYNLFPHMKHLFSTVFCFILTLSLQAQGSVKQYVLIEHFTNSVCPPCASKNPAFYSLITQAQYADDVHHVSVHPMFPYPSCVFYQANTTENTAWTGLYPISGTPTIVINGATQGTTTPLLSESKLQTFLGKTSPLYLVVKETGSGNSRSVHVKAGAVGQIPQGNYRIFVAIVEKTVNQQTPNGETVHRDVFRKMLTAVSGDAFSAPAVGGAAEFDYNYTISANWNPDEVYALAFVKEIDTKQVLNSGTRFDPAVSPIRELATQPLQLSPNPASDEVFFKLPSDEAQEIALYNAGGQLVKRVKATEAADHFPTDQLPKGIYLLQITGNKGRYMGKFVKQ